MIRFSFEAPIPNLQDFKDEQDFFFTLSFLYDDTAYSDFHHQQEAEVWLDNSYNEKLIADEYDRLVHLSKTLHPRYIICPDDPKWPKERILDSYNRMRDGILPMVANADAVLMPVVNSIDMYHFLQQHVPLQQFATSYWNRPFDGLNSLPAHHFLGLLNPMELRDNKPLSGDTGMPIKLALRKQTFDQWMLDGCPHIYNHELGPAGMDFFHYSMSKAEIKLAKDNIEQLRRWVDEH